MIVLNELLTDHSLLEMICKKYPDVKLIEIYLRHFGHEDYDSRNPLSMNLEIKKYNYMAIKSDSYKRGCCNTNCIRYGSVKEEPCWGEVDVVDETLDYDEEGEIMDSTWVHACQGHKNWLGDYEPEPKEMPIPPS